MVNDPTSRRLRSIARVRAPVLSICLLAWSSFTFTESANILAIVVLGGMGSQMGVVLAATLLVLIPEFGRNFAEYRMLLFGLAMVLIMVWRPGGLLSHREPTVRLNPLGKTVKAKEAAQ